MSEGSVNLCGLCGEERHVHHECAQIVDAYHAPSTEELEGMIPLKIEDQPIQNYLQVDEYGRVQLADEQLEKIRLIVREEIKACQDQTK